ncbi:LuxR C-terminal-related transcriptional regulator [Amycolatopsis sp. PS_44_ISF1]|uniref:helix-turn-helix transcriptional regulator n=1 Tax=Amycolatopsis sp. PS_44_ISF1 TaxID=2974917 RepID=UPI0028DE1BB9|nr:LuxR C-terminal-related transcriptional regulator [Amycolatopsis sp. PS_44_ISF1]MDT8913144.1 LuxR C-terminal-related transcriptional regulator [Amycolatopsis sp. PS_44_ISF1]
MTTTSFVGRDRELREARLILRDERLVTLVGTGGGGKTRLATVLGASLARDFPGGVWLVDLATRDAVAEAVAEAVITGPAVGPLTLATSLDQPKSLLLLDNCEHLAAECGRFATGLLRRTCGLRVLATSRRPLGVLGENLLEVRPLGPGDAAALFADRARSARPGSPVPSGPDLARLCARLDGVPLAIELAAIGLRTRTAAELAADLDERLLGLGSPTIPPRHRSLGHLAAAAYALCTPGERDLWARLSVFPGPFDLASAVRAGSGGDRPAAADVLIRLAGLIDQSVVSRIDEGGSTCYRLLHTVRRYGADRLREKGTSAAGPRPPVLVTAPSHAVRNGSHAPAPELTRREQAVAELVRAGFTNRAIGDALGISQRTAESHVARIMAKLGFGRRAQISAWVAGR